MDDRLITWPWHLTGEQDSHAAEIADRLELLDYQVRLIEGLKAVV